MSKYRKKRETDLDDARGVGRSSKVRLPCHRQLSRAQYLLRFSRFRVSSSQAGDPRLKRVVVGT